MASKRKRVVWWYWYERDFPPNPVFSRAERFASLAEARREFVRRQYNVFWVAPETIEAALYFDAPPPDCDAAPDKVMRFGPRGMVRVK